ncbi:MAG: TIGR02186 family protein [Thermodesulfobacteriota bacterium]
MNSGSLRFASITVLLVLWWLSGLPRGALACSVHLEVVPEVVDIGTFFQGQTVMVSATVPNRAAAVVEILGGSVSERLMHKGRWGPLWLNRGEVEVSDAPSLYLAASTEPALLNNPFDFRAWGYGALSERIQFGGMVSDEDRGWFLREFLRLKEAEGLYGIFPGEAQTADLEGDCAKVTASFFLRSNVRPGRYEIRLSLIDNGEQQRQTSAFMEVQLVGLPAFLRSLAYDHPLMYGVLAVVLAMMAGLLIGHVFKGREGH